MKKELNICIECESEYFKNSSKMKELCPECAHKLYNYPNCEHKFESEKCSKCGWNGEKSNFLKNQNK